jgi:hypothetical protein
MNSYTSGVMWFDENTGEKVFGTVVSTAFCAVTGTWNMLCVSESGVFKSLNPEAYGVESVTMVYTDADEDDDDDDAEDDA